jgi:hypothetical protein
MTTAPDTVDARLELDAKVQVHPEHRRMKESGATQNAERRMWNAECRVDE